MRNTGKKLLLVSLLSAAPIAVPAQTAVQDSPPPPAVAPASSSQVESRLVSQFSSFAGSEDNARSLVTGLRGGTEITLSDPAPQPTGSGTSTTTGTTTTTGTAFTPPTRPMGYGNVRIALSLAQEQLAQSGITQPTSDQIRTALMGGTITTTSSTGTGGTTGSSTQYPGVLQMRADGMGWGQIANSMGVKLGAVMSGRGSATAPTTSTTSPGTARAGAGITTAAGVASASAANGRGNSNAPGQSGQRPGAGIVTAAGSPAVGASAGARAYGGGNGAGVTTAAGVAAHGGGNGQGLAKGHTRN